ncbi:MAG: PAS domain-containing protein [Oscillospiraceae bacterium]|nr:PAS domain-containing protein [Oscillospiraceae bacterium]
MEEIQNKEKIEQLEKMLSATREQLRIAREQLHDKEYESIKYKLANDALNIALWDMDVTSKGEVGPNNRFNWSSEFRKMLGFTDENDFPNVLSSWSECIHPEEREAVLDTFAEHLFDYTGKTPYDIKYRMLPKNSEEYGHYHALGTTLRDDDGMPIKTAGALIDITEKVRLVEKMSHQKKMLSSMEEMDVILLAQKEKSFDEVLGESLVPIAEALHIDRIDIYQQIDGDKKQRFGQIYRWSNRENRLVPTDKNLQVLPEVEVVDYWISTLERGEVINVNIGTMKENEREFLEPLGVKSLLTIPVIIDDELWGMVDFQDLENERLFDDESMEFLVSVSRLCANAIIKNNIKIKLDESNQRNRLMLDSTPICCQLWNSAGEKIDCNESAVRLFGFKDKADYLERHKLIIPKHQPNGELSEEKIASYFKKTLEEGSCVFDWNYRMLDGTSMLAEATLVRVGQEDDYFIAGYTRDLREHKKLMDKVYRHEQAIVSMHELNELRLAKLRLVIKSTKIGLWDLEVVNNDPIGDEYPFNYSDEFRQMLGFTNEKEFPNVIRSWKDRIHPNDRDKTFGDVIAHLSDVTGETPYDSEYRLLKKNGEYGYFRATGETYRKPDGTPIRTAGALIDITMTKNLFSEIEKQRNAAEAANKAKSDFLSTMSHEIRTPLSVIMGITEIRLKDKALDIKVREAFNKIYVAGDLLLGIIDDILDLSKIETGKLELFNGSYEVASLVYDTVQLNVLRIGSKPIEFKLLVDEKVPLVLFGDELRIKQILNNLLTNAFKYTEEGHVEFAVSAEEIGNDKVMLVLRVSDTGHGMTQEQIKILFDKFTRFAHGTNRTIEGTGLGMSITLNLVNMMNGEIDVESKPGVGSTFTVCLPQVKVGTEVLGQKVVENLRKIQRSELTQNKKSQIEYTPMPYGRVLIVDDIETNVYVARGLLSPYELVIESVNSGFKALELIVEGNVYDVIFMDHMMPKMDGIETTRLIRETGYSGRIVALTANAVTGQAAVFLENGFDDFVSKPIDTHHLDNILNKFIRDEHVHTEESAPPPIIIRDSDEPQLFEAFIRDASRSITVLESVLETINAKQSISEEEKSLYDTHVHGMRGALNNIGNTVLSGIAAELEYSAKTTPLELSVNEITDFIESLRTQVNSLEAEVNVEEEESEKEINRIFLRESLREIKSACDVFDVDTANDVITLLRGKSWSQETRELIAAIDRCLLNSDFDEIAAIIENNEKQ